MRWYCREHSVRVTPAADQKFLRAVTMYLQGLYPEHAAIPHYSLVAKLHLRQGSFPGFTQKLFQAASAHERQHRSLL